MHLPDHSYLYFHPKSQGYIHKCEVHVREKERENVSNARKQESLLQEIIWTLWNWMEDSIRYTK